MTVIAFLAALARRRRFFQGLAVVGLAFYGTWLLSHPVAFLVAGALLLLDLATDRS